MIHGQRNIKKSREIS